MLFKNDHPVVRYLKLQKLYKIIGILILGYLLFHTSIIIDFFNM